MIQVPGNFNVVARKRILFVIDSQFKNIKIYVCSVGTGGLSPEVKLTTYLRLILRLLISGSVPLVSRESSWRDV
jgi:hypothetical protein